MEAPYENYSVIVLPTYFRRETSHPLPMLRPSANTAVLCTKYGVTLTLFFMSIILPFHVEPLGLLLWHSYSSSITMACSLTLWTEQFFKVQCVATHSYTWKYCVKFLFLIYIFLVKAFILLYFYQYASNRTSISMMDHLEAWM